MKLSKSLNFDSFEHFYTRNPQIFISFGYLVQFFYWMWSIFDMLSWYNSKYVAVVGYNLSTDLSFFRLMAS